MRTPHLLAGCTATDPASAYCHAELAIWDEFQRSLVDFPRVWLSPEEGAMVLGEEIDELRDEVRANHIGRARAEAMQVGAMALRFNADLGERTGSAHDRGRAAAAESHLVRPFVGPQGRSLASSHEGLGFLQREYDALWSAIRFGDPTRELPARVQGMAVRFIAEITSVSSVVAVPGR